MKENGVCLHQDVSILLTDAGVHRPEVVMLHGVALTHAMSNRKITQQDLSTIDWLLGVVRKRNVISAKIMIGRRGKLVLHEPRKRRAVVARCCARP